MSPTLYRAQISAGSPQWCWKVRKHLNANFSNMTDLSPNIMNLTDQKWGRDVLKCLLLCFHEHTSHFRQIFPQDTIFKKSRAMKLTHCFIEFPWTVQILVVGPASRFMLTCDNAKTSKLCLSNFQAHKCTHWVLHKGIFSDFPEKWTKQSNAPLC